MLHKNYATAVFARLACSDCSFIQRFLKEKDKPLTTTERNSLLSIIAALCDYSAIKHQERGAATQIAKMTDEIGCPVSDETVRRAMEKIPGALESRMK
jgi:hypothetical protein